MVERAASAIYAKDSLAQSTPWETLLVVAQHGPNVGKHVVTRCRESARAALLAALDPEDEALVSLVSRRLADDATTERNEMRMMRQGIDLSNANPVSPAIFTKEVRAILRTLRDLILSPQAELGVKHDG